MDYGLAYRYRPEGRHKEYKEDPHRQHDGTLEFTSIDAHKGVSEFERHTTHYTLTSYTHLCKAWILVTCTILGLHLN